MRTQDQILEDYKEFRGKCRELCKVEMDKDSTLTLVRGHYCCSAWGEQPHWWCVRADGTILDPSCRQFPSNGAGVYVPLDGWVECSQCGKQIKEEDASFESNYAFCSGECRGRFVGVY